MAHYSYNSTVMPELQPSATYTFDPVSARVLEGLPAVHMSHQKLKPVIDSSTNNVTQTCESNRVTLRSGLSYDQFLQGMLFRDEQMIGSGRLIYYTDVVFQLVPEPEITSPPKKNMTRGRLFLTNHRILLLSAEQAQGLSIESTGNSLQDSRPKSYILRGRCSDVLHYQCLPLGCIKSVELDAAIGVASSAHVIGRRPGCCLACFGCCGCDMCLKSWYEGNMHTLNLNHRILTLGVTLPPWGHKYMIEIHVDATVPLNLLKDFIVELQHFAPDLYTGAVAKKE